MEFSGSECNNIRVSQLLMYGMTRWSNKGFWSGQFVKGAQINWPAQYNNARLVYVQVKLGVLLFSLNLRPSPIYCWNISTTYWIFLDFFFPHKKTSINIHDKTTISTKAILIHDPKIIGNQGIIMHEKIKIKTIK